MPDSKKQRVYLDSAATSFPKPDTVLEGLVEYLKNAGNPGRGAHSYAMYGARRIMEARQIVARFLGIQEDERLIFTPGCTASINFVIKGYLSALLSGDGGTGGGFVLTSGLEHNSVMRPLSQVAEGRELEIRSLEAGSGISRADFLSRLESCLQSGKAKFCAITAASNVTGQVLPFKEAASLCQKYDVACLVDGAQVAGKLMLDLSSTDISFFCASGHKGLMGPPGVGLLYLAPGFDLNPLVSGGTGSGSESFTIPKQYPDRLEAGTASGHDIWALARGVEWLLEKDPSSLLEKELELCSGFLAWAEEHRNVRVYGVSTSEADQPRVPVISFDLEGHNPGELAHRLDEEYGIAIRPGLHCAAQAHQSLGTLKTGLCRLSFGPGNDKSDLGCLTRALEKIIGES